MPDINKNLMVYQEAVREIKNAILQSRYRTAANANIEMLNLYFSVGEYISANSRSGKWGTGAVETISKHLQGEIPGLRGFSPTNMRNMRTFFEQWSPEFNPIHQLATDELDDSELRANHQLSTDDLEKNDKHSEIALTRQLPTGEMGDTKASAFCRVGFTHHVEILTKCKNSEERWFYVLRCAAEFWSVASLKNHIRAGDYVSYGNMPHNFTLTIPDEQTAAIAVRSFRDDYLLDFVDIKDTDGFDELDVVNAIAADVRKFIMAAGEGFSFIGHQYRLIVDNEEFFVDMLFFERNLQCLVAFELKRDKFRPADLGQLSFYLTALDKYVRKPNENKSIGILLCEDMNRTVVELAVQDYDKPLGVATYRLKTGIPEPYSTLIPVIDGVQQIIAANGKKKPNDRRKT